MNILPASENNPNELGCVLPHYSPVWKRGKDYKCRFTLASKCCKEMVPSPEAIVASPLKIWISGRAHFALMTPEQLLQAAVRFSDAGGWRDMLQKRERVNKECIEVCDCSPPRGAIRGQV